MAVQAGIRTAVITGANRGLGYGLAETIARAQHEGTDERVREWRIVLTARDDQKCTDAVQKILNAYPRAKVFAHALEITDAKSVDAFVQHLRDAHGARVDVLVNNAGVYYRDQNSVQQVQDTLRTNFHGVIDLTEKVFPLLAADGKVIVVSSQLGALSLQGAHVHAQVGQKRDDIDAKFLKAMVDEYAAAYSGDSAALSQKWANAAPYNVSKCLINAYFRSVLPRALPSADQACYTMSPGWVRTDMGGANAPRSLEQGVDTMYYLAVEVPFRRDEATNGQFFMDRKILPF